MFEKYQGVFRSRWKALIWAAGVLLTAYCAVPQDGDDPSGGLMKLVGSHPKAAPQAPVDPWALDKKNS
jgi:hypothetical protein